jgi:hypothetical protein
MSLDICGNATPQNCPKVEKYNFVKFLHNNVQLRRVALKEMFLEYNSTELSQMKCFGNTILLNFLKGNVLRIQFWKIVSKEMF